MTYKKFVQKYIVPLKVIHIILRKKFILPIKFFFERKLIENSIIYPDPKILLNRIGTLKNKFVVATKRNQRADAKILEAQIKELEWVAYGKS